MAVAERLAESQFVLGRLEGEMGHGVALFDLVDEAAIFEGPGFCLRELEPHLYKWSYSVDSLVLHVLDVINK